MPEKDKLKEEQLEKVTGGHGHKSLDYEKNSEWILSGSGDNGGCTTEYDPDGEWIIGKGK